MSFIGDFFSVTIPDTVTYVFDKIGAFLDAVVIFSLNIYSVLLILIFIALFMAYFGLPVFMFNYYQKYKKTLFKMLRL